MRQGGAELRPPPPGRGLTAAFHEGLPVIRSRKNDRLRLVRSLASRRGRRRQERFLLEGPKVLGEALERDPRSVEQVLFRVDADEAGGAGRGRPLAEVLAAARGAGVPCYPVDPALFDDAAPAQTPQACLGVARLVWTPLDALLGEAAPLARAVAACVGVQDPGNLGTILRTARFFGLAGTVVLPGTQDPFSPKVVRSSAGSLLERPPAQAEDADALFAAADAAALTPVALVARGGAPLSELPARALLLLGGEGPGLDAEVDAEVTARAGLRVTIASPAGTTESLNVAVAFAIVAHAWAQAWARYDSGGER